MLLILSNWCIFLADKVWWVWGSFGFGSAHCGKHFWVRKIIVTRDVLTIKASLH